MNQFLGEVARGAPCGYRDRVADGAVLGVRDSKRSYLAIALGLALVLHLPLTPFPWLLRWLGPWLHRHDTSWDYQDDRVIVPISLVEAPVESPPPAAEPPAEAKGVAEPAHAPHKKPRPEPRGADAGAPDAGDAGPEAGRAEERTADAGLARDREDAGGLLAHALTDAGARDAAGSAASVKDTLALSGALRQTVSGKPNVAIAMWFSTLRSHPLGQLVSSMLACNPQWKDFLGEDVDPVRDLDGVLLSGPRMTETSKVTVIVQTRMDAGKIREILRGLVAMSPASGGFLDAGAGVTAARFRADRADRVAFTHPPGLVIITPPEGYEQLRSVRGPLPFPPSQGRAMSVTLVTPWRPARGLGLHLPETLRELRLDITAAADGGFDINGEFDDKDAESAQSHAADVTAQIAGLGGFVTDDVQFVPRDEHLVGHTHLSRMTSAIVLGFVRSFVCPAALPDAGQRPQ
jgi:hypothetical protein